MQHFQSPSHLLFFSIDHRKLRKPLAMEPEAKTTTTGWTSQTNWTIATGSLEDCVTFESSLDDGGDEVEATTSDSTPKSPLILYPSSADSGPCEIKINFAQKHEVIQIYVRSTARVFEIYSEANLQSSNEYLDTVRCGFAARDGEVLQALNIEEIVSLHIKGSNKELAEENIKNEDDWVEVKVPDAPVLDGRKFSLPTKSNINSVKSSQDLFEATAEITDANPCISVTLRLLSLQNKGCICVDDIYVFAAAVTPADSERQESHEEKAAGSSVMAMFLPTLMQFSKTTGLNHINEKYPSVRKEKKNFPEVDLGKALPNDSIIKTQVEGKASITGYQEMKLQEVDEDWAGPSQLDIPLQVAPMESNHSDITSQVAKMESGHTDIPSQIAKMESNHSDIPSQAATMESNSGDSLGGNVERGLEKLVSRMDRIEEICLGFQEKMLMPISSIEARLQQVEQQLETLTKKMQSSGLPSCPRISSDGSCIQSDDNSLDNCQGYTVTEGIKSDKKDFHIEVTSVSPDVMSDSANTTLLLPGLVVTAPEFPDGEDEEENNALGLEMNSSNDRKRQHLSIDDALASALAGFLSSPSLESTRYTKTLTIRAPEFTNEDDHENNNASPRTLYEIEKNDSVHLQESERIDSFEESTSYNSYLETGEKVNRDHNDKHSEETAKEAEEYGGLCSGEDDQDEVGVEASILAEHNQGTGFNRIQEDNKNRNVSGQIGDGLFSISDIPKLHQTDCGSCTNQGEECASTDLTVATEVPKKASHEDIIENVLGFSRASSVVNFEIPILDVKFISQKKSVTKPFLEALLVDTPETNSQDPSVGESSDDLPIKEQLKSDDDLSVAEQYNLVSVDVGELVNPATNSRFSVDKDYCTLINVPVDFEGDNLHEDRKRSYDEISTSLI